MKYKLKHFKNEWIEIKRARGKGKGYKVKRRGVYGTDTIHHVHHFMYNYALRGLIVLHNW